MVARAYSNTSPLKAIGPPKAGGQIWLERQYSRWICASGYSDYLIRDVIEVDIETSPSSCCPVRLLAHTRIRRNRGNTSIDSCSSYGIILPQSSYSIVVAALVITGSGRGQQNWLSSTLHELENVARSPMGSAGIPVLAEVCASGPARQHRNRDSVRSPQAFPGPEWRQLRNRAPRRAVAVGGEIPRRRVFEGTVETVTLSPQVNSCLPHWRIWRDFTPVGRRRLPMVIFQRPIKSSVRHPHIHPLHIRARSRADRPRYFRIRHQQACNSGVVMRPVDRVATRHIFS